MTNKLIAYINYARDLIVMFSFRKFTYFCVNKLYFSFRKFTYFSLKLHTNCVRDWNVKTNKKQKRKISFKILAKTEEA